MGSVDYSIVGFGSIASTAAAPIPSHPGSQILGPVPGPPGNFAAFAQTWDFSSPQTFVYLQHSSFTGFVTEVVQDADATPAAGLATVSSTFTLDFTIGAAGLPASVQWSAFAFGGLIGPAGGYAEFDASIDFASSVLGPLGGISLLFATAAPGSISSGISGSHALPPLPPLSILTVSGTFALKVDDNPGDGLVTEFGAIPIPEPSTLTLLGTVIVAFPSWRHRRPGSARAGGKGRFARSQKVTGIPI